MTAEKRQEQEQQRLRRARVNKIRKGIVITIATWMIVSFLAIVILSVSLIRMNGKIKRLEQSIATGTYTQTMEDSEKADEADAEPFANLVTGIDTEDNMAAEGDEHLVYLTFDSVPGDNTLDLLRELRKYNVKATFFVSGEAAEENADICQQIVDEGHAIGMRSYSNQMSKIYSSREAFLADYQQIHDYILTNADTDSRLYRFPGGSGNEISNLDMAVFAQMLTEHGVTYYDWNVSAGDASADYTSDTVIANVTQGVSQYKTSVVLLHDDDTKSNTVEAIGPLIEALQDMGAEILPIDDNTKVIQYIHADSIE